MTAVLTWQCMGMSQTRKFATYDLLAFTVIW